MSIGSQIRAARIRRGLQQKELAALVGVRSSAISNYESDRSSPKDNILIRIMAVLDVDANYIFADLSEKEDKLTADELELVRLYRGADESARQIALETLQHHQKKSSPSTGAAS